MAIFLYLADAAVLSSTFPFQVTFAIIALAIALSIWRVVAWSRLPGWNAPQMLALASGVLGLFILVSAPIEELMGSLGGKPTHGTSLVALAFLIMLIVLARRTSRRMATPVESETHASMMVAAISPTSPAPDSR